MAFSHLSGSTQRGLAMALKNVRDLYHDSVNNQRHVRVTCDQHSNHHRMPVLMLTSTTYARTKYRNEARHAGGRTSLRFVLLDQGRDGFDKYVQVLVDRFAVGVGDVWHRNGPTKHHLDGDLHGATPQLLCCQVSKSGFHLKSNHCQSALCTKAGSKQRLSQGRAWMRMFRLISP